MWFAWGYRNPDSALWPEKYAKTRLRAKAARSLRLPLRGPGLFNPVYYGSYLDYDWR